MSPKKNWQHSERVKQRGVVKFKQRRSFFSSSSSPSLWTPFFRLKKSVWALWAVPPQSASPMNKNAKLTLNQRRGCWVNFKPLSPTFRTWKIFPTVTWIESNYSTRPSHPSSHSHFISFSAMQMLSLFGLGDVSWRGCSSQCGNTTISWRQAQIDAAKNFSFSKCCQVVALCTFPLLCC